MVTRPQFKIRALEIFSKSAEHSLNATVEFSSGLNVIRADNSAGKSTLLLSLVYALGLESMIGPSKDIPLPHVMTEFIDLPGGDTEQVSHSGVRLEVENAVGEIKTIYRTAISPSRHRDLITVYHGTALTSPGDYASSDFFARRGGAATREAGFHSFLANFIGFDLPLVTNRGGSESPLYLETLFPYFFIEQKHGWSGIQSNIPRYLGIQNVAQRSAEYVLGLSRLPQAVERRRALEQRKVLEAQWNSLSQHLGEIAKSQNIFFRDIPEDINNFSKADFFSPFVPMGDESKPLEEAIEILNNELSLQLELPPAQISSAEAKEIEDELAELQFQLKALLVEFHAASSEESEYENHISSVDHRIEALQEDLERHRDALTLNGLGSDSFPQIHDKDSCPTCGQVTPDGFELTDNPMSIEESVNFIKSQIELFHGMRSDYSRVKDALERKRLVTESRVRETRRSIRLAKEDLTSPAFFPSSYEVERKIRLEYKINNLERFKEEINENRRELAAVHSEWEKYNDLIKRMDPDKFSQEDKRKLSFLQRSIRDQLKNYGFESLSVSDIDLSQDTYRPVYEGFDLGKNISASDGIRLIWAYLLGFLEAGLRFDSCNHPGLVIFDEPRQQSTDDDSFEALFRHASAVTHENSQIIISTSEPAKRLAELLSGIECNLISFQAGEKILSPS